MQRTGFQASQKVLEFCREPQHRGFIAWHTVATIYYLLEMATDRATANAFLIDLLDQVDVGPASALLARAALGRGLKDTEDALQLVVAEALECDALVTRNTGDFVGAAMPVQTPEDFLAGVGVVV